MSTETIESTVIGTPFGDFRVADVRSGRTYAPFVYLFPVDGEFTINRKTYDGMLELFRSQGGGFYVKGAPLTDAAREKVEEGFAVLDTEYPPLNADEQYAKITRDAVRAGEHLAEMLVYTATQQALQKAGPEHSLSTRQREEIGQQVMQAALLALKTATPAKR